MRVRLRIISWGFALAALSLVAILAGAYLSPRCADLNKPEQYDIAVVLGAGMKPDGRLHQSSLGRVEAGVALWENGVAARLHFTGGRATGNGAAAGAQMAKAAIALGAPPAVVTHEDASQSTLQNALFSRPQLAGQGSRILVSEGFHLTRSWLSFSWAGLRPSGLCHSARFRDAAADSQTGTAGMLAREVLAFWFNAGRAAAWSAAQALGFKGPKLDAMLQ